VSLSKDELFDLMAYADGEVDPSKVAQVESLIAKSEVARRVLEQQGALRQWVLDTQGTSPAKGGADGIADAVMAKIREPAGASITTLDRARARGRPGGALPRQYILWVGPLAAVAASVALFYFWSGGPSSPRGRVAIQEGKTSAAPPSNAPAATPAPPAEVPGAPSAVASAEPLEEPGIDVQAVESPQHQFSIFYVPGGTGANAHASSVVVWIGEE
jgi:hypothetical protein